MADNVATFEQNRTAALKEAARRHPSDPFIVRRVAQRIDQGLIDPREYRNKSLSEQ
jgi:hypothetical protein